MGIMQESLENQKKHNDLEQKNYQSNAVKNNSIPDALKTSTRKTASEIFQEADFLSFKGENKEAEKLYKRAISLYGSDKEQIAECYFNLARICQKEERDKEAEAYYKKVISVVYNKPNKSDLNIAAFNYLAEIYTSNQNSNKAELVLIKIIDKMQKSSLEKDVQFVYNSLLKLQGIYYDTNKLFEHSKIQEKIEKIKEKYFFFSI